MVNCELSQRHRFNLGYAHWRSLYGSLTPPSDVYAIDRLFGWADGLDFRDNILRTFCASETLVHDACEYSAAANVVRARFRRAGGDPCADRRLLPR